MKTEEYIETIVSAHANMRWMDASELREILNKVTDMTRKEERENAVKQLQNSGKEADKVFASATTRDMGSRN